MEHETAKAEVEEAKEEHETAKAEFKEAEARQEKAEAKLEKAKAELAEAEAHLEKAQASGDASTLARAQEKVQALAEDVRIYRGAFARADELVASSQARVASAQAKVDAAQTLSLIHIRAHET